MEKKMVQVTVGDEVRSYPDGTCFIDIAREYQGKVKDTIMLVLADGKLRELHKHLHRDCHLGFVTVADEVGHKVYKRSACMMLVKAVYDVAGKENVDQVTLHFFHRQWLLLHNQGESQAGRGVRSAGEDTDARAGGCENPFSQTECPHRRGGGDFSQAEDDG